MPPRRAARTRLIGRRVVQNQLTSEIGREGADAREQRRIAHARLDQHALGAEQRGGPGAAPPPPAGTREGGERHLVPVASEQHGRQREAEEHDPQGAPRRRGGHAQPIPRDAEKFPRSAVPVT